MKLVNLLKQSKVVQINLLVLLLSLSNFSFAESDKLVKVLISTSEGDIFLELNEKKAPLTVQNFVRYANEGFYDGTIFHRVIKNFMIQGGGFDQEMNKKETHEAINNEAANGLLNVKGTISMARMIEAHSASSQFFINTVDNGFLDPAKRSFGYAVFGKVTKGMDVVEKISTSATSMQNAMKDVPVKPVIIKKVAIL